MSYNGSIISKMSRFWNAYEGSLYPSFKTSTIALFAFKVSLQKFVLFSAIFHVRIIRITTIKLHFIFTYFLFLILIFIITISYKKPSNASNSIDCPQLTLPLLDKKLYLSVMSVSLCSQVRFTFVSTVTQLSTSETKPWPLLLFLVFFLDVSLGIVEVMLQIGFVIVLEGTESLGMKTFGIVRYFVTYVDLPDLVLLPRHFFFFSC